MVAEMRQPHALFRRASSARWLPLVEFGTVSCCHLRRASGPPLLLIEVSPLLLCLPIECLMKCMCVDACSTVQPTSRVADASSSRPSCCLPIALLAAPGCTNSSAAASFDSSRFSSFLSTTCVRVLLSVIIQYLLCHAICLGDLLNICMSCWSFKCSGYGRALCVVRSRAAYISCMRVSRICPLVSVIIPVLEVVVTRRPPCSLFPLYTEAYLSNSQTNFLKETALHYNPNYGYGSILLRWMKDWM